MFVARATAPPGRSNVKRPRYDRLDECIIPGRPELGASIAVTTGDEKAAGLAAPRRAIMKRENSSNGPTPRQRLAERERSPRERGGHSSRTMKALIALSCVSAAECNELAFRAEGVWIIDLNFMLAVSLAASLAVLSLPWWKTRDPVSAPMQKGAKREVEDKETQTSFGIDLRT